MKQTLSASEQELINKFDLELLNILKADLQKFNENEESKIARLVDFRTRKYDFELLSVLNSDILVLKNMANTAFARVV